MEVKYGYSRVKYACNGATVNFAFPFPYLNAADIQLTVWDTEGDAVVGTYTFTFLNPSTITVSPTPPNGYSLLIWRNSSTLGQIVDFTDGTAIKERDLDNAYLQAWYTAQEALDEAGSLSLSTPDIDDAVLAAEEAAEEAAASAAAALAAAAAAAASAADATTLAADAAASAAAAAASVASLLTAVLYRANNLSDLTDVAAARDNLGLTDIVLGGLPPQDSNTYAVTNTGPPGAYPFTWTQLGSAALHAHGDYLHVSSNLSDLANAGTARTNLGLGALATLSSVDEAHLALADNTTADVSTAKHGFVPKAPNDTAKVLLGDGTWGTLPPSSSALSSIYASYPGTVTPWTGAMRWYPKSSITLASVTAYCNTAPTVACVIDVKKNGVSVFSGTFPTIGVGNYTATPVSVSVALASTDYLTVDVTSGNCSDLGVRIDYS